MPFLIKREITIGTIVQLGGLLLSGLWFAQRTSLKQEETLNELRIVHARVDRIEKYLSSKDSQYWEIIRRLDENSPMGSNKLNSDLSKVIPTQEGTP
jgi:hypothetical protein